MRRMAYVSENAREVANAAPDRKQWLVQAAPRFRKLSPVGLRGIHRTEGLARSGTRPYGGGHSDTHRHEKPPRQTRRPQILGAHQTRV
jgi:hypothetical protein